MRFLLFFLVSMSLFGPRLHVVDLMLVFCAVLAVLNIARFFLFGSVPRSVFLIVCFLFLSFFYFLTHFLLMEAYDLTYLGILFKYLIYLLAADFLVYAYRLKYAESFDYIILVDLVRATALNSLFVIFVFISPSFQDLVSGFLNYSNQLVWLETGHRAFDISLGGGASGSFTFSLVFFLALCVPKRYRFLGYGMVLVLIFVAIALMGRTGLYLTLVILGLYLCFGPRALGGSKKIIWSISVFFGIVFIALPLFFLYFLPVIAELNGEFWIWALEGVVGENKTAKALENMWIMPDEGTSLIFGDGHYGRIAPNLIYSDVGYVRAFHATGLFGAFLIYLTLILFVFLGLGRLKLAGLQVFRLQSAPVIMLFLILIMNLKEFHLGSRGTFLIFFVVIFCAVYQSRDDGKLIVTNRPLV